MKTTWIKVECDESEEYYPTYYCDSCGAIVCVPSAEELPRTCKVCSPTSWYDDEGEYDGHEYYDDDDADCGCD